jgi:CPA2 family monovalent cation:H+ antiporter-2
MGEREIARGIVEVVTGKPTDPAGLAMAINPQPA